MNGTALDADWFICLDSGVDIFAHHQSIAEKNPILVQAIFKKRIGSQFHFELAISGYAHAQYPHTLKISS